MDQIASLLTILKEIGSPKLDKGPSNSWSKKQGQTTYSKKLEIKKGEKGEKWSELFSNVNNQSNSFSPYYFLKQKKYSNLGGLEYF